MPLSSLGREAGHEIVTRSRIRLRELNAASISRVLIPPRLTGGMRKSNAVLFHQLMHMSFATALQVRFQIQNRLKCITCHCISAKLRVLTKIRFVPDGSSFELFQLRRTCLLFWAGANVRLQKTRPLPKTLRSLIKLLSTSCNRCHPVHDRPRFRIA